MGELGAVEVQRDVLLLAYPIIMPFAFLPCLKRLFPWKCQTFTFQPLLQLGHVYMGPFWPGRFKAKSSKDFWEEFSLKSKIITEGALLPFLLSVVLWEGMIWSCSSYLITRRQKLRESWKSWIQFPTLSSHRTNLGSVYLQNVTSSYVMIPSYFIICYL